MRLLTSPNASADAKWCAGTSAFPADQVHRIAVLDMRLGNTDRNGSNVLAKRHRASGEWVLTPPEHFYPLLAARPRGRRWGGGLRLDSIIANPRRRPHRQCGLGARDFALPVVDLTSFTRPMVRG